LPGKAATSYRQIRTSGARKTAADVESCGRMTLAMKVDVRDRSEVDAMVKAALGRSGKIDVLFNNAGASIRNSRSSK
jgi:NADP-dependent 3-hydroxy acid dehydrogenase YdfG